MDPQDRLRAWAEHVLRVNATVNLLGTELQRLGDEPPLAGVCPEYAAAVLLDVWRTLQLPDPALVSDAGAAIKAVVATQLRAALDAGPLSYIYLAAHVDAALGRVAQHHAELVRTADFGQDLELADYVNTPSRPIFMGVVASLAPGNCLRPALKPDELYPTEAGPCFVPGRGKPMAPLDWYFTSSVLYTTRQWRAEQKKKENEQRAREENERLDRERRRRERPAGREAQLKARIAALEAQLAATGRGG